MKTIGSIALIGLCVVMLAACSGLEQRQQNHPPLWKIHSAHHDNNVWLFGTMHTMPRGKSTRMRKIQRVLSGVSPRLVRPPWVSNEIFTALVSGVNYFVRSATTIMAGVCKDGIDHIYGFTSPCV